MIKVSESASKKIVAMMEEDGFNSATDYVRVGVKSGGCSGLSYELKFDKEIGENDKVFEDNNVKIAVEKKSFLYLAGTILEYSGGPNGLIDTETSVRGLRQVIDGLNSAQSGEFIAYDGKRIPW